MSENAPGPGGMDGPPPEETAPPNLVDNTGEAVAAPGPAESDRPAVNSQIVDAESRTGALPPWTLGDPRDPRRNSTRMSGVAGWGRDGPSVYTRKPPHGDGTR